MITCSLSYITANRLKEIIKCQTALLTDLRVHCHWSADASCRKNAENEATCEVLKFRHIFSFFVGSYFFLVREAD